MTFWDAPADDAEPEMVSASELNAFVYCERAWFLKSQGFQVSATARSQMDSGIAFHESRTSAARKGTDPRLARWAYSLLLIAALTVAALMLWGGQ